MSDTATVADVHRIAPSNLPTLVVSEVFGPTVQGEGPSTGVRAAFVRLGGCNLHCAWCDTPYTWDASRFDMREQMDRRSIPSIVHDIEAMGPTIVVITGGEPLLQQGYAGFESLTAVCRRNGWAVEVETNGTQPPAPFLAFDENVTFNVSPKLAHAGDPVAARLVPDAIAALRDTGRARWKFVIRCDNDTTIDDDLYEVDRFVEQFAVPLESVWVMPEGTTADAIVDGTRRLADHAVRSVYNLSTRLHVLAWGNERGH